jgi:D-tyrosyl-tRNA(Tyr) deacylase
VRIVVQRVNGAAVRVGGRVTGSIGAGLLALVAIESGDTDADLRWAADKLVGLRVFPDGEGRMNRSVADVGGALLLVPNFTVAGDCRKGRRPSFDRALRPPEAEAAFGRFVGDVRALGVPAETGEFGAHMHVSLENDGPVTLVIESPGRRG